MKKTVLILIVGVIFSGCKSNGTDSQAPEFSKERLKSHIATLASDEMRGRRANEEEYLQAAEYVADHLRKTGLQPFFQGHSDSIEEESYFQQVSFVEYTYGTGNWLKLSNPPEEVFMNDGYIILNPGDLNGITAINSLFFAGYGVHEPALGWDDFKGKDVEGKFVMMVDGIPGKKDHPEIAALYEKSPESLARRIEQLNTLNAAGLIVVSEMGEKYWKLSSVIHRKVGYNPVEPCYYGDPYDPDFPVIMIKPSLFGKHFPEIPFDAGQTYPEHSSYPVRMELSVDVRSRLFEAPNVAGVIPGSNPDLAAEYVVLSAHLDHIGSEGDKIFNGASDNASSCSVLLEVASEMAKKSPARSVVFVFYTAEEPCLWGSNHFIRHFPYSKEDILVNVNVEMVGKNDKGFKGFTAIGPPGFKHYFRNTPARTRYRDYREHRMKFRGSDQFSFFLYDVDAIRFGNLDYPEKHTENDDINIIDFDHVQDAARVLYLVTEQLANQTE